MLYIGKSNQIVITFRSKYALLFYCNFLFTPEIRKL